MVFKIRLHLLRKTSSSFKKNIFIFLKNNYTFFKHASMFREQT